MGDIIQEVKGSKSVSYCNVRLSSNSIFTVINRTIDHKIFQCCEGVIKKNIKIHDYLTLYPTVRHIWFTGTSINYNVQSYRCS